jgi:shikimate kinase
MTVTLLGMPCVGKSVLAQALGARGWSVIDTDHLLIESLGMPLASFIEQAGPEEFHIWEEEAVLTIQKPRVPTVISTGGSVVYLPKAVGHLRSLGPTLWLKAGEKTLSERGLDLKARGVVRSELGIGGLLTERNPLYAQVASHVLDMDGKTLDDVISEFNLFFPL